MYRTCQLVEKEAIPNTKHAYFSLNNGLSSTGFFRSITNQVRGIPRTEMKMFQTASKLFYLKQVVTPPSYAYFGHIN